MLVPLLWAVGLLLANAFPHYASEIPHGDRYPALGHVGGAAGGALSRFGRQFQAAQGDWAALCALDADGDGETNGQELGDPCCTWLPGAALPPASERLPTSDPADASSRTGTPSRRRSYRSVVGAVGAESDAGA